MRIRVIIAAALASCLLGIGASTPGYAGGFLFVLGVLLHATTYTFLLDQVEAPQWRVAAGAPMLVGHLFSILSKIIPNEKTGIELNYPIYVRVGVRFVPVGSAVKGRLAGQDVVMLDHAEEETHG